MDFSSSSFGKIFKIDKKEFEEKIDEVTLDLIRYEKELLHHS